MYIQDIVEVCFEDWRDLEKNVVWKQKRKNEALGVGWKMVIKKAHLYSSKSWELQRFLNYKSIKFSFVLIKLTENSCDVHKNFYLQTFDFSITLIIDN